MASNAGWDKTTPAGSSAIASGDDNIRAFKAHMENWWEDEHYGTDGSANSAGVHKEGSARAHYASAAPTAVLPQGQIWYDSASSHMRTASAGGTGSWQTVHPATNSVISQAASDVAALRVRNAGVSHGLGTPTIASFWEDSDVFGLEIATANTGGAEMTAIAEDAAQSAVLAINTYGGTADATKNTSAIGLVNIASAEHDGANSLADITADGNVFAVRARRGGSYVTLFVVDEDGDLHAANATVTASFDTYDDAALVRTFATTVAPEEVILGKWDEFVQYGEDDLVAAGILGDTVENGGLVNTSRLQQLLVGATWQQEVRVKELEAQVAGLVDQLKALKA